MNTSSFKNNINESIHLYAKYNNTEDQIDDKYLEDTYSIKQSYIAEYDEWRIFDFYCNVDGEYRMDLRIYSKITFKIKVTHLDGSSEYVYDIGTGTPSTEGLEKNFMKEHLSVGDVVNITINRSSTAQGGYMVFKRSSVDSFVLDSSVKPLPINCIFGNSFNLGVPYNTTGFKGWFTEENGQGQQLTNASGASLSNYSIASNINAYPYYN